MSTATLTQDTPTSTPVEATLEVFEDSPTIYISAGVQTKGENSGAHSMLDPDAKPAQVADALLRCVVAAAQLHSPATHTALRARLIT